MSTETIFEVARSGDTEAVRAAFRVTPALVRASFHQNVTLLHVAAERDDVDLAEALLDAGADLEAETSWGHTPLLVTAEHQCTPEVDR